MCLHVDFAVHLIYVKTKFEYTKRELVFALGSEYSVIVY